MTETRWWTYVQKLIGNDTAQDAAKRAGFSKSAFTRWKQGANADPEFVVQLARAYGVNVVEALAESGLITDGEAALRLVAYGKAEILRSTPIAELAEEIIRKAKELPRADADAADSVQELTRRNQPEEVDYNALRSVADSSPREDGHGGDESAWDA
ncbi:helix-turn-helix domain-containing protein [Rhodococcus qingshengii]|uniref:helix-turn-helix domain-containing protein n=1 Tax=Rhodococcus qingshengii TaxID=334542 RepID=UPI0037C5F2C9